MKPKLIFCTLGLMTLSLLSPSCQGDEANVRVAGDDPTEEQSLEQQSEEMATTRLDITERRVNELMERVRQRSEKLDRWEDENLNISGDAKLEIRRLKSDLNRLEKELDSTIETAEDVSEENFRRAEKKISVQLQRTEDELKQIQEELSEWYDDNRNN